MSPSFRQQISSNITETEQRLHTLETAPRVDPRVVEGERKELEILRRKLRAMPEDAPEPAFTH